MHDDMFSRFDTIPTCDRQTDWWTDWRTDVQPIAKTCFSIAADARNDNLIIHYSTFKFNQTVKSVKLFENMFNASSFVLDNSLKTFFPFINAVVYESLRICSTHQQNAFQLVNCFKLASQVNFHQQQHWSPRGYYQEQWSSYKHRTAFTDTGLLNGFVFSFYVRQLCWST